jgi:primary-amine oxidase
MPSRPRDVALHPLDPLTAAELEAVVDAVRRDRGLDERHLFVTVQLEEPPKAAVLAWREGDPLDRVARIAIWDQAVGTMTECVVAVTGEVRAVRAVPGAKAPALMPQILVAIEATKADERVRAGLRRRGVEDVEQLHIETWPFGGLIPDRYDDGRRLAWTPMWHRPTPESNQYAHPIHGLYAVVDLDAGTVIDVEDHGERPIPAEAAPYRSSLLGPNRRIESLDVVQPDGPSFTVDGWRIDWQRWSLRVGFCPREGLLIHDVRYDDEGVERRIAHRLSIAELVIPYGDPSPGAYRKNAFDTGEIGVGFFTNSLELGCDCLGEIVYLDVPLADQDGTVRTITNGVCLHEEDFGILWKHTDTDGHVEVRRSRRFVASSLVTVDNYEYGYFWYLYQDGTIEFEAKLTGIVLTAAGEPGVANPYATEIAPGLMAPYHQHVFCARLDLDIDGEANTVVEVDAVAPPLGPENPYGGAFTTAETPLARESVARRLVDPIRSRYWKVINEGAPNRLGGPVGYKLVPGHTMYPLALPDSSIGKRAAFMYHHLWVTPYAAGERYPAGEYPFQHTGGDGLPAWGAADRPTADTDVVLWHVFGTTHVPRPEDWPVMPVERTGFHLKPVGFFRQSPAMDVPPAPHRCRATPRV